MRVNAWLAGEVMVWLRGPAESALTGALRRVGRERPEVFERLGAYRSAAILLSPADLPVAFRMIPNGERGAVRVVRKDAPGPCTAEIAAPIETLLSLMGGRVDADAAFFSRRVRVSGETGAVVALHNAMEAAELTAAELLGLPRALRPRADAVIAAAAAGLRAFHNRSRRR